MILVNSITGKYYVEQLRDDDVIFYCVGKFVCGKAMLIARHRNLDNALEDFLRIITGKGLNRW